MAKNIIKGDDLMLFDSQGHSLAYATSHSLSITVDVTDENTKDHGEWGSKSANKINWEITSENLFTEDTYDNLFNIMNSREQVIVYFGKKAENDPEKTVANNDYPYWTQGGSSYFGTALITSLTANASTGENATFSLTLTGTGSLRRAANGPIARFAILSDIHLSSPYDTPTYTQNYGYRYGGHAIDELSNMSLDFVSFNGDCLLESGNTSTDVFTALTPIFDEYRTKLGDTPLYMIPGNHDTVTNGQGAGDIQVWKTVTASNSWDVTAYNSDKTCYYKEINGELFIWFGVWDKPSFNYTQEMYDWLFNLLETNRYRKRIFLFTHWQDGSVDEFGWRAYSNPQQHYNNGWATTDASHATRGPFGQIKNYRNVIWFSGHAHTEWEFEDTYPTIKIHWRTDTAKMVSIPAVYTSGEIATVAVFDDRVEIYPYTRGTVKMDKTYIIPITDGWETPNPDYPDYIKLTYEVSDVTSPTLLISDGSISGSSAVSLSSILGLVIDGEEVEPARSYQFSTTGEHSVLIKLVNGHIPGTAFYKIPDLKTVCVPSFYVDSSASAFKSCPKLKYARFDMTLTSEIVNNFVDKGALEVVKFGKNIPGFNGANILASIPNMKDIYIEGESFNMIGTNVGGESAPTNYNVHVSSELDQSTIADKFTNGTITLN